MAKISHISLLQMPGSYIISKKETINFTKEYAEFMENTLMEIDLYLSSRNILKSSCPMVCFHNMDLEHLNVEVGYHISNMIHKTKNLQVRKAEPCEVITCIDLGSYMEQDETLKDMLQWLKNNRRQMRGEILYYYLNDPNRPESEYLTGMVIPLK